MICPQCNYDNVPGSEVCAACQQDLTQLDQPTAQDRVQRSLMEDPVSMLRPRAPVTVRGDTTVRQAIETMLKSNIGALLVLDEVGGLAGILSERDLLAKVAGQDPYPTDRPV